MMRAALSHSVGMHFASVSTGRESVSGGRAMRNFLLVVIFVVIAVLAYKAYVSGSFRQHRGGRPPEGSSRTWFGAAGGSAKGPARPLTRLTSAARDRLWGTAAVLSARPVLLSPEGAAIFPCH